MSPWSRFEMNKNSISILGLEGNTFRSISIKSDGAFIWEITLNPGTVNVPPSKSNIKFGISFVFIGALQDAAGYPYLG